MSPLPDVSPAAHAAFVPRPESDQRRRLVVLVHGINADAGSWKTLITMCRGDTRLREFEFRTFAYATGLGRWNPMKRLPSLDTIASELGGFVGQSDFKTYRDVRLVGHSQGGLVIQRYLHQMLGDGRGRELDRIRQVVFFATPTLGSGIADGLRRILFSLVSNAQERELRIFNPKVATTRRYIEEHVSKARQRSGETAQIPIHVFYGEEDNVVDAASAMASFSSAFAIGGDHSGLIAPLNRGDPRYKAFADILLEPIGHRHVFEVERSDYVLRLEPSDPNAVFHAPLPDGRTRAVPTESVARYTRRLHFAPGNRCEDLYEMRYGTLGDDGYVTERVIPPNQWSDEVRREYEQRGTTFRYQFHPEQRRVDPYAMYLTIYRGFEKGNRKVHFHVTRAGGDAWARIACLSFEIDLRPLLDAGWRMTREPELFLLDVDRKHEECPKEGDESTAGALGSHVTPESGQERGIRRWSLSELERGIVNVRWDVEPPTVVNDERPGGGTGD